ncbi:MAG: HAMP domain-containing sensor histidine kinase [Salinivirgaceae bacterium]|jgi:signal transduction histidine kinase|nr:HAMP domain-containing sensor histidine kinase [Salinivirgaceae bacterium]
MISDLSVLKRKLFYFASAISLLGYGIDFVFLENNHIEFWVNLATILITVITIGSTRFSYISYTPANLIIVYSIFINMLISLLLKDSWNNIDAIFLQNSLVYGVLILYAGFALGKVHVYIIGTLFVAFYIFMAFFTKGEILLSNMPLIIVLLGIYMFSINFILNILNNYNQSQSDLITSLTRSNLLLKEQGNELNKLNETKDKLLSIIGHDLRTPAGSIMGFSSLIERKAETMKSESLKKYSKLVYQSANRLNILLSQLLDWARLQSGKKEVNLQLVKVNDVITEVVDLMHGTTYLKNITVESPVEKNIELRADKQMLATIVRNLVTNALKYTPIGGTIFIKSQIIENDYRFSIKDTGIGMSKDVLNKLFTDQLIESTLGTENEKGTGLGMGICKEYVHLHFGKIWAESELGQGATFHFSLPKR